MLLCAMNGIFDSFLWLFFNFSPHSFKIYVENMQLTKETENPLERFLCLLMNLVKMVFLKMHVTGGKKKWGWCILFTWLYFFVLNDLAHSFFVTYILGLSFSYVMKGIT